MDRRVNPEPPGQIDPTNTLFDETKPFFGLEKAPYQSQYQTINGKRVWTGETKSSPDVGMPWNWKWDGLAESGKTEFDAKTVLRESRIQRDYARIQLDQEAFDSAVRRSANVRTILPEE